MALNYAYAILGTAVITGGMVMDEEVLVLYCFVLFVAMAYHYLSTMVDESIRGEASKMGKEFDAFFEIQKKLLKALISYHGLQISVISELKSLLTFSKGEISKLILAKKASLDSTLASQIEQKLTFLVAKESGISQSVQIEASLFVGEQINAIFTTDNKEKKALKEKVLAENIKKLESLGA
jgi:hypothetical protein